MAMSFEEFMKSAEAEIVGDRLIAAVNGVRCFVGAITDGTFTLTDEGKDLCLTLETPKRRGRPPVAETAAE